MSDLCDETQTAEHRFLFIALLIRSRCRDGSNGLRSELDLGGADMFVCIIQFPNSWTQLHE